MTIEPFCPVTGKAKFESAKLAAEVMKRDGARFRTRHKRKGGLQPYRCEHCSAWHLGRARQHRLATRRPEHA